MHLLKKKTQYGINIHFIPLLLQLVIEAGLLSLQTDIFKHFICLLISHTNNKSKFSNPQTHLYSN